MTEEIDLMTTIEGDATIELALGHKDVPMMIHAVRNKEAETLTIYLDGEVLLTFHVSKDSDLKFDSVNLCKKLDMLRLRNIIDVVETEEQKECKYKESGKMKGLIKTALSFCVLSLIISQI